ncbi:CarD family transcriptional regulator [Candidatus Nucleicultrix amoebiphila]|jgi:CarD family transcriptional regulator|uniref:CarD family transcriptional regulator n=1 Tax=Candidatus Nucleicultrix amoebiphila FS5 TaxID=1414854 RepID=A0A1W6N523_9PROT|nr:CarD family transcriptional regulator [Candidatus Nucleicultrix amoebiphila]ARN84868.1 CarD family transcriptional regulator [Candidatus Nucleicultrix amoebiphila FS5]
MAKEYDFSSGDLVVYPAHGVGRVLAIETQKVAGCELKVFVISFERDRMTLRLPMAKATASGLRALSTKKEISTAFSTLKKTARSKKGLWSRRAQEYELKINSGKLTSIAEVIRDLYRGVNQAEQSFSERQIYQAAIERLTAEVAAVEAVDKEKVIERIHDSLGSVVAA